MQKVSRQRETFYVKTIFKKVFSYQNFSLQEQNFEHT